MSEQNITTDVTSNVTTNITKNIDFGNVSNNLVVSFKDPNKVEEVNVKEPNNNVNNNNVNNNNVDNPNVCPKPEDMNQNILTNNITLLNFQVPHSEQLKECIKQRNVVIDGSDTGTGKTYVTINNANSLGYRMVVICPLSVIPSWRKVAKIGGTDMFGIANYEMMLGCKYYDHMGNKVKCPYIRKITRKEETNKKDEFGNPIYKVVIDFEVKFPSGIMVVMDEAHKCKNHQTKTSRLMRAIARSGCKLVLLSATICDKVNCFKPFGMALKLFKTPKEYKTWIRISMNKNNLFYRKLGFKFNSLEMKLDLIHRNVFPHFGSRMKISELGDLFPKNTIIWRSFETDHLVREEIQAQYDMIQKAKIDYTKKEMLSEYLGKLIYCRMKIEMAKIPIMIELIRDHLDEGKSVAVFVNYTETLEYLAHYFETDCVIFGDQTKNTEDSERETNIRRFQSNESKIIICNIQSGGVGISLHDIHGKHPRVSIISPDWSGQNMKQVFGRIHRAKSQSPALQIVVTIANTFEEHICNIIQEKILTISGINDAKYDIDFNSEVFQNVIDDEVNNPDHDPHFVKDENGNKIHRLTDNYEGETEILHKLNTNKMRASKELAEETRELTDEEKNMHVDFEKVKYDSDANNSKNKNNKYKRIVDKDKAEKYYCAEKFVKNTKSGKKVINKSGKSSKTIKSTKTGKSKK